MAHSGGGGGRVENLGRRDDLPPSLYKFKMGPLSPAQFTNNYSLLFIIVIDKVFIIVYSIIIYIQKEKNSDGFNIVIKTT